MQIKVDISPLISNYANFGKSELEKIKNRSVRVVADEFANRWAAEAKNNLNKTRNTFINAISKGKIGNHSYRVYLNPDIWLANAIEEGASDFDMKKGFLRSPKAKVSKEGHKYIRIPFRFATPGSSGSSPAFSGVLPKDVFSQFKSQLKRGNEGKQLLLKNISSRHQMPVKNIMREHIQKTIIKSQRKELQNIKKNLPDISKPNKDEKMTSKFEGLTKKSIGGGRSGYFAFRTVSEKSDEFAFLHPGFTARKFAEKALGKMNISSKIDEVIKYYTGE